jgi:Ca2+-binding EF-hand superfamily protein
LLASPLVAGAATYAIADGDHAPRDLVQKFDKNGDGKLDDAERAQMKAEWQAKRAEREKEDLAKYDANKDGKLDDAERKALHDDRLTQRFQAMDKNGDGKLTLDEFKAGASAKGLHHGRHGHGGLRNRGMKP